MSSVGNATQPQRVPTLPLDIEQGIVDGHVERHIEDANNEVKDANSTLATVRGTLDRLRAWHDWDVRRQQSLKWYILSRIYSRRPPCPSKEELRSLALFFFPPRGTGLKVEICDFGDGRFERCDRSIDTLEPCK